VEKGSVVLHELLSLAWEARVRSSGRDITFAYPAKTAAVSLTGTECGLNCAHCSGHYLDKMITLEEAFRRAGDGRAKSFLISGGCSPAGVVPFARYAGQLEKLAKTSRLNLHVGLVTDEEAASAGKVAGAVSFDFVGDDETIREVYGLDRTVDDYVRSYLALSRHTRVIPHICIGLRGGAVSGERRALDILKRLGAEALVFLVLIPTRGTLFAQVSPPAPALVAEILAEARLAFPGIPIQLGCMRPGGRYRRAIDLLAVRAGVNSIVNPAPQARRLAQYLGLVMRQGEECCVL
jgi:uncharacterized radical SAM superfamily protein